jgi:hypothetical protein
MSTFRPPEFAEVVARAKTTSLLSNAEFDYSLKIGDGCALAALYDVTYMLANRHLPAVTSETTARDTRQRRVNADLLHETYRAEREALITAAKAKSFAGWSDASRYPIRYAGQERS